MTAMVQPRNNISAGIMNKTNFAMNSQKSAPQPFYPPSSQVTVAATPGYFSENLGIVPDNINDIFPQQLPQNPNYNNPQNFPVTTQSSVNYSQNITNNSYNPLHGNNVNNPPNIPFNVPNVQTFVNNPTNNPMNNPQNSMYNFAMQNNMMPTYAQQTPNYGQNPKMTGMPITKGGNAMTRMTTKIPGTRSVAGMTIVPKIEPKKSTQKKKEILYPEFLSIIPHLTDKFWVNEMNSAAIGNFPRLLTYRDGVLSFKKNQKITHTHELTGNDIEKCKQFISFLQDKMSIKSDMDNVRNNEKLQNNSTYLDNMYKSWDDVKKKQREALINNFINETCKSLNLSETEYNDFNETFYRAYYSNYFNTTNIIISNGKISQITNIYFDHERKKLICNNNDPAPEKKINSSILSESLYLNPSMTINCGVEPVNLSKKLKTTVKT